MWLFVIHRVTRLIQNIINTGWVQSADFLVLTYSQSTNRVMALFDIWNLLKQNTYRILDHQKVEGSPKWLSYVHETRNTRFYDCTIVLMIFISFWSYILGMLSSVVKSRTISGKALVSIICPYVYWNELYGRPTSSLRSVCEFYGFLCEFGEITCKDTNVQYFCWDQTLAEIDRYLD